jgi:flagellar motility protein MotE (MotC chaperone)
MLAGAALFALKLDDLATSGGLGAIAAAWAQAAENAKPAVPAAKTPSQPAASAAASPAGASNAAAPPPKASENDPMQMSPAEIDVLQQLAERRAALDKRASELSEQEVVMQAAEKRIDEKIAKLQQLAKTINGAVQTQSSEDDARLQSLAHMYETMKPQDAARIFEQLDMPVLLSVLQRMREMKAAPILAAMDPARAKQVTLALAERRATRGAPAAAGAPAQATN